MIKKEICPRINGECPHKLSKKNTCFIIMAYEQLYSKKIEGMLIHAIEKATELVPILAKNIKHKGSTDLYCTKVCKPIKQATLCIVDLTYNSTNVGLEYAVAQNFRKPVIITTYKPKNIPKINSEEEKIIKKLKKLGAIQYLTMPYHPPDFASLFRIEYKNKKELTSKLKKEFEIKEKK